MAKFTRKASSSICLMRKSVCTGRNFEVPIRTNKFPVLCQCQVNAVRATFKAGITPSRCAVAVVSRIPTRYKSSQPQPAGQTRLTHDREGASQHDNAGSCLSLIVRKPKYPEIDSRENDSAFPPKRLHVSPPSDRNPGAFSFRRARPVAFHNGAVPRSGRPGHLWKMCGGSRQQSHGTVIFLRLSAAPRWRSL